MSQSERERERIKNEACYRNLVVTWRAFTRPLISAASDHRYFFVVVGDVCARALALIYSYSLICLYVWVYNLIVFLCCHAKGELSRLNFLIVCFFFSFFLSLLAHYLRTGDAFTGHYGYRHNRRRQLLHLRLDYQKWRHVSSLPYYFVNFLWTNTLWHI